MRCTKLHQTQQRDRLPSLAQIRSSYKLDYMNGIFSQAMPHGMNSVWAWLTQVVSLCPRIQSCSTRVDLRRVRHRASCIYFTKDRLQLNATSFAFSSSRLLLSISPASCDILWEPLLVIPNEDCVQSVSPLRVLPIFGNNAGDYGTEARFGRSSCRA